MRFLFNCTDCTSISVKLLLVLTKDNIVEDQELHCMAPRSPSLCGCLSNTQSACSFHGVASTFETDKYLVIVDASDQRQHTISFALVSNADVRPQEFDHFHESRSSNGVGQITKREVRHWTASPGGCDIS